MIKSGVGVPSVPGTETALTCLVDSTRRKEGHIDGLNLNIERLRSLGQMCEFTSHKNCFRIYRKILFASTFPSFCLFSLVSFSKCVLAFLHFSSCFLISQFRFYSFFGFSFCFINSLFFPWFCSNSCMIWA